MIRTFAAIEPLESRIAPAFAGVLEVTDLDPATGFKFIGEDFQDFAGIAVGSAGDMNGDGFDDVVIGAALADPFGKSSGEAYVVFGKEGGYAKALRPEDLNGRNGFRLTGAVPSHVAGRSISAAGDVNGDGFADLLIGSNLGAYLVFGKAERFPRSLNLEALDGSNGVIFDGLATPQRFHVGGGGDINGDGFADILIGMPDEQPHNGETYVVFGKAQWESKSFDLASLDGTDGFKLTGNPLDMSGFSIAIAGDVNGDGFDDLVIGADGARFNGLAGIETGAACVVFGKASGFANLSLSSLDGTNGFKLRGEMARDQAGRSVSGAGDFNGDGFDDVLVGGRTGYVVFGKASGFAEEIELATLDGTNGFRFLRTTGGSVVTRAGDINADGFADIAVDGFDPNGSVRVIFGKSTGIPAEWDLSQLDGHDGFTIVGKPDSYTGAAISNSGDFNGDGFDDLLIGAPDEGENQHGAAYIIYGGDPGRLRIAADGHSAHFTDVDGDRITVTTSAGMLTKEMFDLRAEGLGFQLEKLHLTDPAFTKASITFSAVRQDATGDDLKDGNKKVNIGFIDATDVALGIVTIPGDLGQIDASKIKTLAIGSLGAFGTTAQDSAAPSLHSDITRGITNLNIAGDIGSGVTLAIGGRLGTATIGGNLDGATLTVGGALAPMTAADAVAIASLTIGGHVNESNILAGYDLAGIPGNADVSIGSVIVRGAWSASSLVAGIVDSTGDGFGRNDTLITGGMDGLIATIASIKIKGLASGSSNTNDFFGVTAESIGKARITGQLLMLTPEKDDLPLDGINENFRLVEL